MKSLAKVFIRIFSIYLVIRSAEFIPQFINLIYIYTRKGTDFINDYHISLLFAIEIVFGVLLWIFADKIAKSIVGKANDDTDVRFNMHHLQIVAFSIIGIVFVIDASLNISVSIAGIYTYSKMVSNISNVDTMNLNHYFKTQMDIAFTNSYVAIIGSMIKIILGIWLIVGSTGFSKLIQKIRKEDISNSQLQINEKNEELNNSEEENDLQINVKDLHSNENNEDSNNIEEETDLHISDKNEES